MKCKFCNRTENPKNENEKFFGSPNAFICDTCARMCKDILNKNINNKDNVIDFWGSLPKGYA